MIEVHCKVRTMLKLNNAMERMMKECKSSLAFKESEAETFINYSFAMCQLHLELTKHFGEEDEKLFSSLPKMHMLLHSCLLAGIINPRLAWCFRGGDLQKISRSLAGSCAKGLGLWGLE
ncbi:unnamed protein product [Symbiodinium natans]|uniref:Hemerythrin-like domain-containing protein n=1 Tax=Symbiodinium natans TaxID=878477 RepID=A0A812GVC8_9DINO|nr:unnamed protein product [Symbiodinium natans]